MVFSDSEDIKKVSSETRKYFAIDIFDSSVDQHKVVSGDEDHMLVVCYSSTFLFQIYLQ